jgi:type II secretory pathway pseudopilin PulG
VEALLAASVLAIVTASAALPFAAGIQQANQAARLEAAVALGQSLMEEILARPYYSPGVRTPTPGPESGESREIYNSIDDFNGCCEQPTGPRNYQNQPISDSSFAGLWRDASVSYVSFSGQPAGDTNSFVRIIVRVWDGDTALVTLTRLVSRED